MIWFGLAVVAAVLLVQAASARSKDLVFMQTCDGSAAVVVDGFVVIANDEDNILRLYRPRGGAPVAKLPLDAHLQAGGEADIESAAVIGGRSYWITSHGRNSKAKRKPERFRFFATTASLPLQPVGRAREDLLSAAIADPRLSRLGLEAASKLAPEAGGVNIEALAAGPGRSLLIGFRSPLARLAPGQPETAFVVPLLNPEALVTSEAPPVFGTAIAVDLGGRGIRDLLRTRAGDYVIIAGPTGDTGDFALFRWTGRATEPPRLMPANLAGLHPEALIEIGGGLVVLSDDGDKTCKDADPANRRFRGRPLPSAR